MSNVPALSLVNIEKSYFQFEHEIKILKNTNLEVDRGQFTGLIGPSGCGKTTLLQIAGLLDKPDSGEVIIDGVKAENMTDKQMTFTRGHKIGFVYQFHNLLKDFTALENVMMPLLLNKASSKEFAKNKSEKLLEKLGILHRAGHYPNQLSGGEQQRVAIARALIHDPVLLLADEPTGNLDPETAESVFSLMKSVVKDSGLAALIVTHNHSLLGSFDKTFTITNGQS